MVNRGDALGTNEWRNLPLYKQMGFELPIEVMLDIPHLRQNHNVMTMTEYLRLQGLNTTRERPNGSWDRTYYHEGIDRPSLFVIPNNIYDPEAISRVDVLPPPPLVVPGTNKTFERFDRNNWTPDDEFGRSCNLRLLESTVGKNRAHLDWAEAMTALKNSVDVGNGTSVDAALKAAGWVVLYTWDGA